MQRKIQITADGSHTIAIPGMDVTYHSHHGAVQESRHVFIKAGLHFAWDTFPGQQIRILEIGFGTGLNALLSWQEAVASNRPVVYTAIEKYPLATEEVAQINYGEILGLQQEFLQIHTCGWEHPVMLHHVFTLEKQHLSLPASITTSPVHCIYFDAFAPTVQPELWSQQMFEQLYGSLHPSGILVTYSSKGDVRRAMVAAGFTVQKIPGPYGKREMVRAIKQA